MRTADNGTGDTYWKLPGLLDSLSRPPFSLPKYADCITEVAR